ncbi:MAG: carboxypeptidase-like regulatory domain-containing protein, partial [Planctomycetia bacterium]
MGRAPVLLALLMLLGLLLSGLWWGVQGGMGTIRASSGEQSQDPREAPGADALAAESTPSERSGLAPLQSPNADELAVTQERVRPPGTRLFGTVLDAEGAPLADAEVLAITASSWIGLPLELDALARPQEWSKLQRVRTDAEGRYELHGLSGRQLRVMARKPGHVRAYLPNRMLPKSFDQMELEPLRLAIAQPQHGTVLDTGGAPIVGARILRAVEGIYPDEPMPMEGAAVLLATSSAGGEFTLREEAAGLFALWAQA